MKHFNIEDYELIALSSSIFNIEKGINSIMSAIDDLNSAISQLSASISSEIDALKTARANSDESAVEAAVSNINNLNEMLKASVSPAPVNPAPTPAV